MDPTSSAAIIERVRQEFIKSYGSPIGMPGLPADFFKASTFAQSGSATSGLTFYDLELGAKLLYPVLTPLRNMTPRTSGKGGIQAAWRAITAINTSGLRLGLGQGNRNGYIGVQTKDYTAAYKGLGLDAATDFEAQYAAEGFDDARAKAALATLQAVMIGEEQLIVGGNTGVALGQTATPTATPVASGGALADATYSVICVGLTLDAYINGSVAGGIQAAITRTNADASSDTFGGGAAKQSAAASAIVTGGSGAGKVTATVAVQKGAVAYAWFWSTPAGSEILGAITTINSVVILATATGTQTAASLGTNDNSQNALVFDGLMYLAWATGSGSYIKNMATGTAGTGTALSSDNAGGIAEIETMLQDRWDNYRLSPTTLWVNSQEQKNITSKILGTTSGNPGAHRFVFNADQSKVAGGVVISSYRNRYSMNGVQDIPVRLHPNVPPGTILATTDTLPYPLSNVSNVFQMRLRQDYYQFDWPLRSRKYEHGVYFDGVLQHYFPPSLGIVTNIANA